MNGEHFKELSTGVGLRKKNKRRECLFGKEIINSRVNNIKNRNLYSMLYVVVALH
jgi:hypothetical protein